MNELTPAPAANLTASEALPLAQELACAHGRLVRQLREQYGLSTADAAERAERMADGDDVERHLACPTELLSWHALDAVARRDPARAAEVWERVREEARLELATGHRAARAVEASDANCVNRARFLALRDELTADWRPTTGQERILIDTMAQALTMQERWLRRLVLLDALETDDDEPSELKAPRVPMATAIDQASNMIDRFNKIFTRALRQLRDLRRFSPQIVVKNAGQVNVANHVNLQ